MQTNLLHIQEEYKVSELTHNITDSSEDSCTVYVIATHSGVVNNNNRLFPLKELKKAAKSFMAPYPKPVLVNHDQYKGEPIGRVTESIFIYADKWETAKAKYNLNTVSTINEYADGVILLKLEIADMNAMEKVTDKRFLTVSIGGSADDAICSICGKSYMYGLHETEDEEPCHHVMGKTYDGKKAYLIYSGITFDEISFVNIPADKYAQVAGLKKGTKNEVYEEYYEEDVMSEKIDSMITEQDVAKPITNIPVEVHTQHKEATTSYQSVGIPMEDYNQLKESNAALYSFVQSVISDTLHEYREQLGVHGVKDYSKLDISVLRALIDEYKEITSEIKRVEKEMQESQHKSELPFTTEPIVVDSKEIQQIAPIEEQPKLVEIEETKIPKEVVIETKTDGNVAVIIDERKIGKEIPPVISENEHIKQKPSKITMREILKIKA